LPAVRTGTQADAPVHVEDERDEIESLSLIDPGCAAGETEKTDTVIRQNLCVEEGALSQIADDAQDIGGLLRIFSARGDESGLHRALPGIITFGAIFHDGFATSGRDVRKNDVDERRAFPDDVTVGVEIGLKQDSDADSEIDEACGENRGPGGRQIFFVRRESG